MRSAKRMYYPQTYHHIQEIQKYNIQDYRPRYVLFIPISIDLGPLLILLPGWSNSKKPSEKSARSSGCANNVATPSRKPTNPKHAYYKHTTQLGKEDDTEKWQVRGRRDIEVYDDWVLCIFECSM